MADPGKETTAGRSDAEVAAELRSARFAPVRLTEGYQMGQVDAFLDLLAADLESGAPRLGAGFVAAARFAPVRLTEGYQMGQVDALLDRVEAHLRTTGRTGVADTSWRWTRPGGRMQRRILVWLPVLLVGVALIAAGYQR